MIGCDPSQAMGRRLLGIKRCRADPYFDRLDGSGNKGLKTVKGD